MFEQLLAISRNTFLESIRQPVVLVLLTVATLMLIVANLTATFTMDDDQKMLIDVGLATVFLFGALLAAFIATNVITREIDNKTVLTVVSKPVGRPIFVAGKYIGVAGAILMASFYMAFVFMLVEHHGVLQTVRDPVHLPVVVFGLGALAIVLIVGVWCNYFYNRVFASTVICVATPLAGLAYFLSLLFDAHFEPTSIVEAFDANLWKSLLALVMATLVLTAVAIAISSRLNQVMTVIMTIVVFLAGMLSDWMFGTKMMGAMEKAWLQRASNAGETQMVDVTTRFTTTTLGENIESTRSVEVATESLSTYAEGYEQIVWFVGKVGHSIVPNFQTFWLSDAVTQQHVIPSAHLVKIALYCGACVIAALSLAVILFQRREVG